MAGMTRMARTAARMARWLAYKSDPFEFFFGALLFGFSGVDWCGRIWRELYKFQTSHVDSGSAHGLTKWRKISFDFTVSLDYRLDGTT